MPRRLPLLVVLVAACVALPVRAAGDHLLAGARHFREGRFPEALVEFRVAEKLGPDGEAAWYSAACLVRLDRPVDAVEAFAAARKRAPRTGDALFDYYEAVACHDARLYLCADRLLSGIGARGGPRIREEALKLRARVDAVLRPEPATAAIDWYLERASEATRRGRDLLAGAYLREAAGLSARRADRYRAGEALGRERRAP